MKNKVTDFVVGLVKDPTCVLNHEFKKHNQENRRSYLEGLNNGCKMGNLLNDINNRIIRDQNEEIQKLKEEISELNNTEKES